MPVPEPTADELVAMLKRSRLPTVLVEGTGDRRIYRSIENQLGTQIGDVLSCGGRLKLLQVYRRRSEFVGLPTAFLADQDHWLFTGIPEEFVKDIVWTRGFTIENDAYCGSVVESLLSSEEKFTFNRLLDEVCEWFAFEIQECIAQRESNYAASIGRILNRNRDRVCEKFLLEREFQKPSAELFQKIRKEYFLLLRGKTLFDLIAQLLNAPSREAKHQKSALVEMSVCCPRNPDFLGATILQIKTRLQSQPELPLGIES